MIGVCRSVVMEPPDPSKKRNLPCEEGDKQGNTKKPRCVRRGGESTDGDAAQLVCGGASNQNTDVDRSNASVSTCAKINK